MPGLPADDIGTDSIQGREVNNCLDNLTIHTHDHSSVLKTKFGSIAYFLRNLSNHLSIVFSGTTSMLSLAAFSFYLMSHWSPYLVEGLQEVEEVVSNLLSKLLVQISLLLNPDACLNVRQRVELDDELQLREDIHARVQGPACVEYVARPFVGNGPDELQTCVGWGREVEGG